MSLNCECGALVQACASALAPSLIFCVNSHFFPLWCLSPSSMWLDFLKKRCLSRFQAGLLKIFRFQRRFLLCFGDWSFNGRPDPHAPWPASSCRHSFFKSLKFIKKMFPLAAWSLPSPSQTFCLLAAVCWRSLQLRRAPVMNPRALLFVLRSRVGVEWRAGFRKTNSLAEQRCSTTCRLLSLWAE